LGEQWERGSRPKQRQKKACLGERGTEFAYRSRSPSSKKRKGLRNEGAGEEERVVGGKKSSTDKSIKDLEEKTKIIKRLKKCG